MSYIAETFMHNGYTVKLIADGDAESPDSYGDDGLFIVTTHNRYFEVLHDKMDASQWMADEKTQRKQYWIFPVYAYIHSGVALSLGTGGQFSDQWDSGQIGFVFASKSEWRYERRERKKCVSAFTAAKNFIETWNQYLSGDVWGYVIEDPDGEHIGSCWGFYGLDNAKQEAISSVPEEAAPIGGISEDEAQELTLS